ncbi:MAG: guanylate kinase [Rhodospirillales bacterium]|nr:guanylate kinase [Rhodospirillales bacterium]
MSRTNPDPPEPPTSAADPRQASAIIARRGLMLVLSSPSGAGKSSIARALLRRDDNLSMSVSVTTRAPRSGEIDGADYTFVSESAYAEMVAADGLLEHARVFGNHYGTPRAPVEDAMRRGRDVLFDVDWQGTQQLRQNARADLVSIFILPPSRAELERRLRQRAQDPDEVVRRRMAKAADEMSHWAEYDYVIVNDCLETAVAGVEAILAAERLRRDRRIGLAAFVAAVSA